MHCSVLKCLMFNVLIRNARLSSTDQSATDSQKSKQTKPKPMRLIFNFVSCLRKQPEWWVSSEVHGGIPFTPHIILAPQRESLQDYKNHAFFSTILMQIHFWFSLSTLEDFHKNATGVVWCLTKILIILTKREPKNTRMSMGNTPMSPNISNKKAPEKAQK